MNVERVDPAGLWNLVGNVAPEKRADLGALLKQLSPEVYYERHSDEILFRSRLPNQIIVGVQATRRLQAHALSAGVVMDFLGTSAEKPIEERHAIMKPAWDLLSWAVAGDLKAWLARIEDAPRDVTRLFPGAKLDLSDSVFKNISRQQSFLGQVLFTNAAAYILLHELAHLYYGHSGSEGIESLGQERQADSFSVDWLVDSPAIEPADRAYRIWGIAVALVWVTVRSAFLGPKGSNTHPEPYDRLFQSIERACDYGDCDEELIWDFVWQLVMPHARAAGFQVADGVPAENPKEEVSVVIDRLINRSRL